jgi:hypothetical protein
MLPLALGCKKGHIFHAITARRHRIDDGCEVHNNLTRRILLSVSPSVSLRL